MGMWWGNIMWIRYLYRGKSLIGIFIISWTILNTPATFKNVWPGYINMQKMKVIKSPSWDGNDMFEAGKISLVLQTYHHYCWLYQCYQLYCWFCFIFVSDITFGHIPILVGNFPLSIWRFLEIRVPPNHPFYLHLWKPPFVHSTRNNIHNWQQIGTGMDDRMTHSKPEAWFEVNWNHSKSLKNDERTWESMDWFSRENLHRKPMGFYHQIQAFPVNCPIIQFHREFRSTYVFHTRWCPPVISWFIIPWKL